MSFCGIRHFVHSEGSTGCELCLTLSNSFGMNNLQQCSITVYILSFISLFVVCCCSCVLWRCCGFRCPRAHKEMRQLKSQTSIQKTRSRPSFDAVEKYVQNRFDASRYLKKSIQKPMLHKPCHYIKTEKRESQRRAQPQKLEG